MAKPLVTFELDRSDYNYVANRLLGRMPKRVANAGAKKALEAASVVFIHKHLKPALSYEDHTLESLKKLGHPYARRHGSIRIHQNNPWVVHKRSGAVLDSVTKETQRERTGWAVHVFPNYDKAKHVRYVFEGTRNMLPRNPFKKTATSKRAMTDVQDIMIRVLLEELDKV